VSSETPMSRYAQSRVRRPAWLLPFLAAACTAPVPGGAGIPASQAAAMAGVPVGAVTEEQLLRGRQLVISRACGDCHGGMPNPASEDWLTGHSGEEPSDQLGPFRLWARNLTPDDETGLGTFSERQIFNALRFGLRPRATPDVEITSAVPGEGNHPAEPDYLAPGMPWVFWRYMSDQELWDIAAYLKHGLRPVRNAVPDSDAPPDRWASEFMVEKIGTHVLPAFPTEHEELSAPERREQVLSGRALVASTACSGCHGGALNPAQPGWLSGMQNDEQEFEIGPFRTRPRNLTPHNTTGMGRFSERQIFNALRFGLRPGETADVEITSTTPGVGNHPVNPKYMAPPMPWPAWRHLSDAQLWAIAAYLRHGVRPVDNRVADSEGPPDFWAGEYTADRIGSWPAPPFPTPRERRPTRSRNPDQEDR
jgi:mono/diheme cytochrome c family protein